MKSGIEKLIAKKNNQWSQVMLVRPEITYSGVKTCTYLESFVLVTLYYSNSIIFMIFPSHSVVIHS